MANPEDTRQRILDAARSEFIAAGFAGARIDAIARRAGCNKQLIYHHVGDKLALFKEVLREELGRKNVPIPLLSSGFHDTFIHLFDDMGKSRDRIRLLLWEALAFDGVTTMCEDERKEKIGIGTRIVEEKRVRTGVFADVDTRFLLVAFFSLAALPWILPQVAKTITGLHPSEPSFRRSYSKVLRAFTGLVFDEAQATERDPSVDDPTS